MADERLPAPVEADLWATEHADLLIATFRRFELNGWPTLERLQHDFELTDDQVDVSSLAFGMPNLLGFVEGDRLILRVRALLYVPGASRLLDDWFRSIVLAYARWRADPDAQFTKSDVLSIVDGDETRGRATSVLLLRESWPFGSGSGGPDDDWSREIYSGVRIARDARDPAELLDARTAVEYSGSPLPISTAGPPPANSDLPSKESWLRRSWRLISENQLLAGLAVAFIVPVVGVGIRKLQTENGRTDRTTTSVQTASKSKGAIAPSRPATRQTTSATSTTSAVPAPTLGIPSLTPAARGVATIRMRGINRTYRPRWGQEVVADATDALEFEAQIKNQTEHDLQGLLLLVSCTVFCSGGSSQPLALRASVATANGVVLATSRRIKIKAQSGGLVRFTPGDKTGNYLSEVLETGLGSSSDLSLVRFRISPQPPEDRIVEVFRVDSLKVHARRRLRFRASWDVGPAGQLSSGSSTVRIGHGKWHDALTVSPGQIVTVGVLMDNVAYSHPWTAKVRVHFPVDRAAGTVGVVTNADLADGHDQGGPQPTGTVTLQSSGAGPIDLEMVAGTTELLGRCRPGVCGKQGRDSIDLPDGIADRGIDVGPLGGFVPRDKQSGTQFTRMLTFKVKVKRYRAP